MRVCATPAGHTTEGVDRLAAAAPDRAWNFGLRQVELGEFTHLGKLDGDIEMPPELLAELLERFRRDPMLGIAGASLEERSEAGEWESLGNPPEHPTGACRLYSRECFAAIGGMPERMGADAITIGYAKMRGYRVASFADLRARHLRPHGAAQGLLRGHARHGAYQYIVCYSAAWIALRSLSVSARQRPYGASGAWFLAGAAGAALRRAPRVEDPAYRAFMRSEQRRRLARALRRG
jgi:poly-beta-1,6-N-acetyl-D-glucosamine synthase